jgi:hypothetical protein
MLSHNISFNNKSKDYSKPSPREQEYLNFMHHAQENLDSAVSLLEGKLNSLNAKGNSRALDKPGIIIDYFRNRVTHSYSGPCDKYVVLAKLSELEQKFTTALFSKSVKIEAVEKLKDSLAAAVSKQMLPWLKDILPAVPNAYAGHRNVPYPTSQHTNVTINALKTGHGDCNATSDLAALFLSHVFLPNEHIQDIRTSAIYSSSSATRTTFGWGMKDPDNSHFVCVVEFSDNTQLIVDPFIAYTITNPGIFTGTVAEYKQAIKTHDNAFMIYTDIDDSLKAKNKRWYTYNFKKLLELEKSEPDAFKLLKLDSLEKHASSQLALST